MTEASLDHMDIVSCRKPLVWEIESAATLRSKTSRLRKTHGEPIRAGQWGVAALVLVRSEIGWNRVVHRLSTGLWIRCASIVDGLWITLESRQDLLRKVKKRRAGESGRVGRFCP